MNKSLILTIMLMLATISAMSQTYHEDDKEGLRVFLRQSSAEKGKINAERLGLKISDTLNWQSDEGWVTKVRDLDWNKETPRQLIEISWRSRKLAGDLNTNKWTNLKWLNCSINQLTALELGTNTKLEVFCDDNQLNSLNISVDTGLQRLYCDDNKLSVLNLSTNTELQYLWCQYNLLSTLEFSACTELKILYCSNNQLNVLDFSANTKLWRLNCSDNQLNALYFSDNSKLRELSCYNNHLSLSNLFAISEILQKNRTDIDNRCLGSQTLSAQTINLGKTLEFSAPQNVFNGIYTEFTVTKNKKQAILTKGYTLIEGKILFNKTGTYTVKMMNKAIISSENYPAEVIIEVTVIE